MPLRGLNRNIILKSFYEYNFNDIYFVNYFLKQLKINNKFEFEDFGYLIGPILNSGGRLNKSNLATQLIISENKEEIEKFLKFLLIKIKKERDRKK